MIFEETTPKLVALDATAREMAARVVPHVQSVFDREDHGGVVDIGYVFHGATGVGLNHWTHPDGQLVRGRAVLPHWFVATRGEKVEHVAVDVALADLSRAEKLAALVGAPVDAVLSVALCTGLCTLLGSLDRRGPWAESQ